MVFSVEGCDDGQRIALLGEPFMRAHHTQKLDHYSRHHHLRRPFFRCCCCRERFYLGLAMCPGMFYISSDSPTLYLPFHSVTLCTHMYLYIYIYVWKGRNISFFTPPEQYRRRRRARFTRMKNVVNIVQFVRECECGFLRFIIFSIRIKLDSSYNTMLGWIPVILDFIPEILWKITVCRFRRHWVHVRYTRAIMHHLPTYFMLVEFCYVLQTMARRFTQPNRFESVHV